MNCQTCFYCQPISGDCHVTCSNHQAQVKINKWESGGIWPLYYDPLIVETCDGYKPVEVQKKDLNHV